MLRRLSPVLLLLCGLLAPTTSWTATDHKDVVSGSFRTGPEVTETCLGCHEQ